MMATFLIEAALALYVVFRYGNSLFRTILVTILLCLASFQFAEYEVCTAPTLSSILWTKVGLIGITLLPALGMHLIGTVTSPSHLITLGYAVAGFYALIFLFLPEAAGQSTCAGNYVVVNIKPGWVHDIWVAYYDIFLGLAILELILRFTGKSKFVRPTYSLKLILWTLVGYLSFVLPTAIVTLINSQSRHGIPSIMCGFALLLALLLTLKVAPLYISETSALTTDRVKG